MTFELKLRPLGNSVGTIFPEEILARLNAKEGDILYLVEASDGFRLTAKNPESPKAMDVAEEGMLQYRDALRKLAK